MAWEFTISIPDNIKDDIAAAFASAYDYTHNTVDATKKEFVASKVKQYISDIYKGYKMKVFNRDKETIRRNADIDTNSIEVI